MRLVDDEHDPTVSLRLLGLQELLGLDHHLGLEEARLGTEGADHGDVEPTGAEGGVGDVDHLMAQGVEESSSRPCRHRLPGTHLASDDTESRLLDAVQNPGHRLLVRLA